MKRKGKVTLKFKDRKLRYEVMANRKKLIEKKSELKELHFEESLFLSYIMYTGSHNFFYKCLQLKNPKRIYACWFFNNAMCDWWINAQYLRSSMNPIWKNCHLSMLMIYWAVPYTNLIFVIVKLLTIVFFLHFGICLGKPCY